MHGEAEPSVASATMWTSSQQDQVFSAGATTKRHDYFRQSHGDLYLSNEIMSRNKKKIVPNFSTVTSFKIP
jgi:hypothetical protein